MKVIHLIGSDGFLGRAIQSVADEQTLYCWSHSSPSPYHKFDLYDQRSWNNLLNSRPECVILLSWPGLPNYDNPTHITRNLPASLDLIERLADAGLKKIIVAGTCYEYGLQNGSLQEQQLTDPVNCYAIAKDSLRRAMAARLSASNTQWCWARIFYMYGDGQRDNSLYQSLLHAIESGFEEFPMGSGRQLRDFINVNEAASQLLRIASHRYSHGIYNIGSGKPQSVLELAENTIASFCANIKLKPGAFPDRHDEPLAFWADTTKLHSLTNNPSKES